MRVRRMLGAGSTAAVVALGAVAAGRAARLDERSSMLIALETLTPWLFLPAWGALGLAVADRRRLLAGAAAVLCACHAAWVWPDLPWRDADQPAARGPGITLVTVNAYKENGRAQVLGRQVAALRPDLVTVQELTPLVRDGLARSGLLEALPYHHETVQEGSFGGAVYSRFPLRDTGFVTVEGVPLPRATVDAGGVLVDLVSVHTAQPMAAPGVLADQLQGLGQVAWRMPRPLILAGDFNATRQYRPFRRLLGGPLRDAHLDVGRGFARTWPAIGRTPAFSLIDHVLVSGEIAVRSVSERTLAGTDHRAVVARLQLPSAACARQGATEPCGSALGWGG